MSQVTLINAVISALLGDFTGTVEVSTEPGKILLSAGTVSASFSQAQARVEVDGLVIDLQKGQFELAIEAGKVTKLNAKPAELPAVVKAEKAAKPAKPSVKRTGGSATSRTGMSLM